MGVIPLKDLIKIAREKSNYYRSLYGKLPNRELGLEELPVVNQEDFWNANLFDRNRLLTADPKEGILFRSGGTTGNPKFSFYTRVEWASFTNAFGRALGSNGLKGAKRVANLFYAGELYASFLFIHESLENAEEPVVNFPISGGTDPASVIAMVDELKIDTLAGVPTTLLKITDQLVRSGKKLPWVERILYGGESMYPDQRAQVGSAFSGARIVSVGYASVDAGLLGYADEGCAPDEHRAFSETILEIVNEETGARIDEKGKPGKIVVTNLTRTLMPIIRYPAGDRAEWVEDFSPSDRNRKFRLLGRSEEAARMGPVTIYFQDLHDILSSLSNEFETRAFQCVVTHKDGKDQLLVRMSVRDSKSVTNAVLKKLEERLYAERPLIEKSVASALIQPVIWEVVDFSALEVNVRTGKLRRVIDRRSEK